MIRLSITQAKKEFRNRVKCELANKISFITLGLVPKRDLNYPNETLFSLYKNIRGKRERMAIYKKALSHYTTKSFATNLGFCHYFSEISRIPFREMTELYKLFRESPRYSDSWWFKVGDRESRIEVLETIINKLR